MEHTHKKWGFTLFSTGEGSKVEKLEGGERKSSEQPCKNMFRVNENYSSAPISGRSSNKRRNVRCNRGRDFS